MSLPQTPAVASISHILSIRINYYTPCFPGSCHSDLLMAPETHQTQWCMLFAQPLEAPPTTPASDLFH